MLELNEVPYRNEAELILEDEEIQPIRWGELALISGGDIGSGVIRFPK